MRQNRKGEETTASSASMLVMALSRIAPTFIAKVSFMLCVMKLFLTNKKGEQVTPD